MHPAIYYFCTDCETKSTEETESIPCGIYYSTKCYKKGEYIARMGDQVSHLYMLSTGRVRTEMVSESGLSLHIDEITAPYPLAAAFLFADKNSFPVHVIALEEVEVHLIPKEIIEKQLAVCPQFLRGFMAFNANRTQFLSDRLTLLSQKGIKSKLACYILQRTKNNDFELGKSIASLAGYFGVERPSLSRAISEMVHDGIIEFEKGNGTILDYNAMKEILA